MNQKEGLDYFLLTTSFENSDSMKMVEATFGLKGFAVVIKLWQRIYGDRGYYLVFTRRVALMFARETGLGVSAVLEIVRLAVAEGIFDEKMYKTYSVLTSVEIQNRYFNAVRRRKDLKIVDKYLLTSLLPSSENVNISRDNVSILPENVDILKQSRVEESNITTTTKRQIPDALKGYYAQRVDDWCKRKGIMLPEDTALKWYEQDLKKYGKERLEQIIQRKTELTSFDPDEFAAVALSRTRGG